MQDIVNIISSVGFPIVFCLLLWKYISDSTRQLTEVITDFKVTMMENNRLLMTICNKLEIESEKE
mgnify:CR=1 FL=1